MENMCNVYGDHIQVSGIKWEYNSCEDYRGYVQHAFVKRTFRNT